MVGAMMEKLVVLGLAAVGANAWPSMANSPHNSTGENSVGPVNSNAVSVDGDRRFINFCIFEGDHCNGEPEACTMARITGECNPDLFNGHAIKLLLTHDAQLSMEFFNGETCTGSSTVVGLDWDQCSRHVSPHRNASMFVSHIDPVVWNLHSSQMQWVNQMHAAEMTHVANVNSTLFDYIHKLHGIEMGFVQNVQTKAEMSFSLGIASVVMSCLGLIAALAAALVFLRRDRQNLLSPRGSEDSDRSHNTLMPPFAQKNRS